MIGAHVIPDPRDHLVLALPTGDIPAFAINLLSHPNLLRPEVCRALALGVSWRDLGGPDPDPALRHARDRDQRAARRPAAPRPARPAADRLPRPKPITCHPTRRADWRALAGPTTRRHRRRTSRTGTDHPSTVPRERLPPPHASPQPNRQHRRSTSRLRTAPHPATRRA